MKNVFALLWLLLLCPALAWSQSATEPAPALLDTTIAAGEADAQTPVKKRGLNKYNEFDIGISTLRLGYGFLVDFSAYVQDNASEQQVDLAPDVGLRDFRFLFKGKFKTEFPMTWTMGIMWDKGTEDWFFRQTGIMFGIPKIWSDFFIGRTKEGYSQYKYMTGYDIWTMERSPFLDAIIPILGDGIKWIIAPPRQRWLLNLGWFNDAVSENEKFATYDNQFVARLVYYLPSASEKGRLLHLGIMGRDVEPDEGQFRAKSKPEAYLAPNFVDTGTFESDHARTIGFEAYYRDKAWLVGGEYGWQRMDAPTVGDPVFHGGNIAVNWLVTGETRGYNTVSGYFKPISPTRTVFEGGPGALELTLNYSYVDLDDGTLSGGKLWRISPTLKWHLMEYMRFEVGYGYGVLDRFDLEGKTHFVQIRLLSGL